jgi:ABC-type multidrug transport system fused ATPase/permease subunit
MDEIERAVKEANAYDFIMKLPHVSCSWPLSFRDAKNGSSYSSEISVN